MRLIREVSKSEAHQDRSEVQMQTIPSGVPHMIPPLHDAPSSCIPPMAGGALAQY